MNTIYQMNASEIDQSLLDSIKTLFKGKRVEITISEIDETEYLLGSPVNRKSLMRAVRDIAKGRNIIIPDQKQFQ